MHSGVPTEESTGCFVFGTSELARLVFHYLTVHASCPVPAMTVDRSFIDGASGLALPAPLLAIEDVRRLYPHTSKVVVAVGYKGVNTIRRDISQRLERDGLHISSFVHSSAAIDPRAAVGRGGIILEQVVVQPFASLGRGVICWSGAIVAHHASVGDWCYLAPGAVISGNVKLGEGVFVGSNATVRDGVTIGDHAVIGAGSLINRDVPPRAVVPGLPRAPDGRDSLTELSRI